MFLNSKMMLAKWEKEVEAEQNIMKRELHVTAAQ
jgi:hypothetical protein